MLKNQFRLQWTYDKQESILLRAFLSEQHISRSALIDIKFKGGRIEVNGEEVTVRYSLQYGDVVSLTFPKEEKNETMSPEYMDLEVLYEDEYILAINKPAGIPSIPSREWPTGSVANYILGYYERMGLESTIHLINRLDRDTSGVMLIAKHRHTHYLCSEEQKKGGLHRIYRAWVEGTIEEETGTYDAPIGRSEDSIITRTVRADGQHAVTHYRVLQRTEKGTYVEIQLETGRTHQIRVHFSHYGHSLLGDDLYGGKRQWIGRQALHSHSLTFVHPVTKEERTIVAPLPLDFQQLEKD